MRTPLDVIMDVEAELALQGLADPSASLFRGCIVCLLPLPRKEPTAAASQASGSLFQSTVEAMQAAAASQQALQECQAKRAALKVG